MRRSKYDNHWGGAVTLRNRLYRLYKAGKHLESEEFKFYVKFFGRETVKQWLAEEAKKGKQKNE